MLWNVSSSCTYQSTSYHPNIVVKREGSIKPAPLRSSLVPIESLFPQYTPIFPPQVFAVTYFTAFFSFFPLSFTKAIFLPLRPRSVSQLLRFQNKPEKTWVIIFVRKHTFSTWQIKRQDFANHRYFQRRAAGASLLPKYRRAVLSDSLERGR